MARLAPGLEHGDFVVQGPDGQPVTKRLTIGAITAASATSVSIKSSDGFVGTFAVTAATAITFNGKRGSATELTVGINAQAVGTLTGTTATADMVNAQSPPIPQPSGPPQLQP